MARDLHADLEAATLAPSIAPIILARVDTASGPTRMWTGYGELSWGGATWYGGGEFLGISPLQETADVQANGMSFSLSGIPVDFLQEIETEARQGSTAEVWFAAMNDAGALVGEPALLFRGLTDVPTTSDDGQTCSVAMTAESRLIDLERARVRHYTDDDQQAEYPGDLGFEFVPALVEVELVWGRI